MTWLDFYLLCFVIGTLWSFLSLLLGGLHLGHAGHAPHGGHAQGGHMHAGSAGHHAPGKLGKIAHSKGAGRLAALVNPTCIAVFLAWFGGVGYIVRRHSGLLLWTDLAIALLFGLVGAWIVATFLQFLQSKEKPLEAIDYDLIGVLGRASCDIRSNGVGEVIYVHEGTRRCLPARSEDGVPIERGQEIVVTRYEKGIAYVRTWEAMTQ